MNNAVKIDKLLEELKDNIDVAGQPPRGDSDEDFSILCEYVTEWMVRKYDLQFHSDINHGYCFIWAYLVWALWNHGGVTFKSTTGHVVVAFRGHYYDSEHIDGRPVLDDEFCGFGYNDTKHVDENWMAWYWARAGRKMREFRRLLRKCNPKIYNFVRDNGNHQWVNPHENFPSYTKFATLPEVRA